MIVTRFAPSPTGYLHVGGARTALFCWLLARHHQGRMILRIEDTDQKRNTPTAMKQVMRDLLWLGIDWDEGPDPADPTNPAKSRGANGPYLQSQRLEIYQQYVQKLIESGHAYYCFDTAEQIDALRREAMAAKRTFCYPRPQRFPTEKDVDRARAEGRPVTVRLAVPQDRPIVVRDIVRGEVRFDPAQIGDFILVKSDGFPTYHFACVVDDELMNVTHVIRGQEHLMNTPGHLALQEALGFRTPEYAHMSVTVSEGGGKLSKRERAKTLLQAIKSNKDIDPDSIARAGGIERADLEDFLAGRRSPDQPHLTAMAEFLGVHLPEINVIDFFQSGYIPEALVNFIALLGWSPGENREILTRNELIQSFDPNRLIKANSLFDRQKLISFNTEHIHRATVEIINRKTRYYKPQIDFIKYLQLNGSPIFSADEAFKKNVLQNIPLLSVLDGIKNNPHNFEDAVEVFFVINNGARTFMDIEKKILFLFTDDITYDPNDIKKVFHKEISQIDKYGVSVFLNDLNKALHHDDYKISEDDGKSFHDDTPAKGEMIEGIRKDFYSNIIKEAPKSPMGLLAQTRIIFDDIDWNWDSLHKCVHSLMESNNVGMGKIAQPIRIAITGSMISPPIHQSMLLLGKEKTTDRIDNLFMHLAETLF